MNPIRINKFLLLSIIGLVFYLGAFAQKFVFSPFELRSELNEDQIRFVNQLRDGRLVIITESSTNLYNVGAVKNIPVDTSNFLSIKDYTNNHFCYVDDEYIWIKNQRDLSIVNIASEKYEESPAKLLKGLGFPDKPKNLFLDSYQDIWVVSVKDQLYCYDRNKKKAVLFLNNIHYTGSDNDVINDVTRLGEEVFIVYRSGLIRCFNRSTFRELYSTKIQEKLKTGWVNSVSAHGDFLYLVTNKSGSNGSRLIRFNSHTREQTILIDTSRQWLNNIVSDKKGNFWVAATDGFWYFDANAASGRFYSGLLLADGYQIKSGILNVFYDNQQGIWMSTNKGLYYYNPFRFSFLDFNSSFFQFNGTDDLRVYCFGELQDKMLIGTLNGIYLEERSEVNQPKIKILVPDIKCHTFFKSSSGYIWVGAEDGVYSITPGGSFSKVLDVYAYSIVEPSPGKLIIGTANNGLLQWDEGSREVTTLFSQGLLPDIRQVIQWNRYWVGFCNNGLFFIDPLKKVLKYAFENRQQMSKVLPPDVRILVCLFADKEGLLWMGTYGGLYVWDPVKMRLYKITKSEGLVNNSVKAIIQGSDHSIWVTTTKGISRIEKKISDTGYTFNVHNYNENDGVSKHAFIGRAAYLSKSGQLYFGNLDGFSHLVNFIQPDTSKIAAVIFNFKLFGRAVEEKAVYDGHVILNNPLTHTSNITLKHDQNFISIQYAGLNYVNPENTHFRYQLLGVDKEWREEMPGKPSGEATYTNLLPGDYEFRIMASSDGYNWPMAAKVLSITVKPPVWATIYARILYIFVAAIILFLLIRSYSARQIKRRKQQQAEAVEREKSKFLTNISHDLRTPLTLIITPLRSVIRRIADSEVKEDLKRIESNADLLLDTVNQLLEFKRMDESGELLHASYLNSLSFLSEIASNYHQLASEKRINFQISIDDKESDIWLDKNKVVRIVMNLLSNAFKFTPDGGVITLSAKMPDTDQLAITVTDTGVGIPESDIERVFDRFYQVHNQDESGTGSGIGLYLVKKYAELHGGYVQVTSKTGQQTAFNVVLHIGRSDQKQMIDDPAEKKVVLIVEDNKAFLEFLKTELGAIYGVLTAQNGKQGFEVAVEKNPDLIITDMMMPEMNGIEFCKLIRNNINISHTPVIMLTARASDEAQFEGYEAGADAYLVKPFDLDMLKLRIRKLMHLFVERQKLFNSEKNIKSEDITTNPLDKELLERAVNCVNQNISNHDYTVEKFSLDMHMDRTGLYRKLMALTGQSPSHFIRTIRLNRAAALLSEPNATVSNIAEEVGFGSVSYFSKCFQEKFGVSPSQYTG